MIVNQLLNSIRCSSENTRQSCLRVQMASAVPELKSMQCDSQSLVTFISRTRRPFSIYWLDYRGRLVKYCQLDYSQQFNVRTYETHPWIFRDSDTGDVLVTADGSEVYMPKKWNGGSADRVIIGIPVYPLRQRCMQVVRSLMLPSEIQNADIPETLKDDILRYNVQPSYTDHVPSHHHHH